MSLENIDWEGLIRAFVISLGTGLLVSSIAYFMTKPGKDRDRWKPVLIMAGVGVILILTVAVYYIWPNLVEVPNLDGLSQAQAEDLLTKYKLIPDARPQHAVGVEAGRVLPNSQNPSSGLPVRPNTVVSFSVNVLQASTGSTPVVSSSTGAPSVSLFQPKAGEKVRPARGADGIYRFSARGTSSGLSTGGFQLLLWMKPVSPPSDVPGWYLQRPPANGIGRVEADGSWAGVAQIGNAQWPPHEGDVLDMAVTIADDDTVNQLMTEAGVVVRDHPVGVKSDTASNVVITLSDKSAE